MSEYKIIYSLEAFKRRIHDDIQTMDETPGTRYREELIAEYLRKVLLYLWERILLAEDL